jgi:hypothetical protein
MLEADGNIFESQHFGASVKSILKNKNTGDRCRISAKFMEA